MTNSQFTQATYLRLQAAWNDRSFLRGDRGAGMVEYSLLVALIAVVAIAAIQAFGQTVGNEFNEINSNFADGIDNNPFAPTP